MLLFMDCSFTLFELQKEGKNTEFNYKAKSQMSLNVFILKLIIEQIKMVPTINPNITGEGN